VQTGVSFFLLGLEIIVISINCLDMNSCWKLTPSLGYPFHAESCRVVFITGYINLQVIFSPSSIVVGHVLFRDIFMEALKNFPPFELISIISLL